MKKLLYFLFLVFSIFALAGCDSVFSDDGDETVSRHARNLTSNSLFPDDDYETIDIGTFNLTNGLYGDSDFGPSLLFFQYSYDSEFLMLHIYTTDLGLSAPNAGTYNVVPDPDKQGELILTFYSNDRKFLYWGFSGSVTVSDDSMTITLSDVLCNKLNDDGTDTGDVVKLIGSTTVTDAYK